MTVGVLVSLPAIRQSTSHVGCQPHWQLRSGVSWTSNTLTVTGDPDGPVSVQPNSLIPGALGSGRNRYVHGRASEHLESVRSKAQGAQPQAAKLTSE